MSTSPDMRSNSGHLASWKTQSKSKDLLEGMSFDAIDLDFSVTTTRSKDSRDFGIRSLVVLPELGSGPDRATDESHPSEGSEERELSERFSPRSWCSESSHDEPQHDSVVVDNTFEECAAEAGVGANTNVHLCAAIAENKEIISSSLHASMVVFSGAFGSARAMAARRKAMTLALDVLPEFVPAGPEANLSAPPTPVSPISPSGAGAALVPTPPKGTPKNRAPRRMADHDQVVKTLQSASPPSPSSRGLLSSDSDFGNVSPHPPPLFGPNSFLEIKPFTVEEEEAMLYEKLVRVVETDALRFSRQYRDAADN